MKNHVNVKYQLTIRSMFIYISMCTLYNLAHCLPVVNLYMKLSHMIVDFLSNNKLFRF